MFRRSEEAEQVFPELKRMLSGAPILVVHLEMVKLEALEQRMMAWLSKFNFKIW